MGLPDAISTPLNIALCTLSNTRGLFFASAGVLVFVRRSSPCHLTRFRA